MERVINSSLRLIARLARVVIYWGQVDEMSGYQYDMLGNLEFDPDSSSSPRTRYYYNSDNLLSQVDYVNGGTTTTTTMTWDADQQRHHQGSPGPEHGQHSGHRQPARGDSQEDSRYG